MCQNCNLCGSFSMPTALQGATGATGPTGEAGSAIVFANPTLLTNINAGSYDVVYTGTIPADSLVSTGDFLLLDIFGRGGDPTLGDIDGVRIAFNGSNLTNPDTSYLLNSETYHFPYSVTNTGMQIKVKITRLSSTTCSIYLYCSGQGDANRVDMFSASASSNNWDSASNSLSVSIYNSTASSVKIQDIVCTKHLI